MELKCDEKLSDISDKVNGESDRRFINELKKILFPDSIVPDSKYGQVRVTQIIFSRMMTKSIAQYSIISNQQCNEILKLAITYKNVSVYREIFAYMKRQRYALDETHYTNFIQLGFYVRNTFRDQILNFISEIPTEMFGVQMYTTLLNFYYHSKNYEKTNEIFQMTLAKGFPISVKVFRKIISDCIKNPEIMKFIKVEQILNVFMVIDPDQIAKLRRKIVKLYESSPSVFVKELDRYYRRRFAIHLVNRPEFIRSVIGFCRETGDIVTEMYIRLLRLEVQQNQAKEPKEMKEYLTAGFAAGKDTTTIFAEGSEDLMRNGRHDLLNDFAKTVDFGNF